MMRWTEGSYSSTIGHETSWSCGPYAARWTPAFTPRSVWTKIKECLVVLIVKSNTIGSYIFSFQGLWPHQLHHGNDPVMIVTQISQDSPVSPARGNFLLGHFFGNKKFCRQKNIWWSDTNFKSAWDMRYFPCRRLATTLGIRLLVSHFSFLVWSIFGSHKKWT